MDSSDWVSLVSTAIPVSSGTEPIKLLWALCSPEQWSLNRIFMYINANVPMKLNHWHIFQYNAQLVSVHLWLIHRKTTRFLVNQKNNSSCPLLFPVSPLGGRKLAEIRGSHYSTAGFRCIASVASTCYKLPATFVVQVSGDGRSFFFFFFLSLGQ